MWTLALTLCLAAGGEAECETVTRSVPTRDECFALGRAYLRFFAESPDPLQAHVYAACGPSELA